MAVTPDVEYVTLTATVGLMVGDTVNDPDKNPDLETAAEGTVTFTPAIDTVHATDSTSGATIMFGNAPIVCTIDTQGRLTYNGDNQVTLLDLGSDKVNPKIDRGKTAWTVQFTNVKTADGQKVTIKSFGINPSSADDTDGDGLINLWDLQPLAPAAGPAIVRGMGVPPVTSATQGDVVTYDDGAAVWAAPTGGSGGTASWDTLTGKPAVIAAGATAADARSAIGAGTSNLALGTTSTTALAGNTVIPAAQVQSDWNAASGMGQILNKPTLGTAAAQNTTAFATAAQGAKADSAVQPSGSITGNAGTATKLATARNIAGVSFDGSADIDLTASDVSALPTTIGSTATASVIPLGASDVTPSGLPDGTVIVRPSS